MMYRTNNSCRLYSCSRFTWTSNIDSGETRIPMARSI